MPRKRIQRRARKGSAQKLPSGRWRARATSPSGERVTLGTFETESLAWDEIDGYSTDTVRGHWTPSRASRITVLEMWDHYVDDHPTDSGAVERSRTQFREGYLTGQAKAAQGRMHLGSYPVGEVTVAMTRHWVRRLRKEGLAPSTIRTHWGHLRRCMQAAVDERRIPANPAAGPVPLPAGTVSRSMPEPYFLTLPEMVAITQATHPGHALMMETVLWSGLRSGEVRALDGPSVLVAARLLQVSQAVTAGDDRVPRLKTTKTRAGDRRVPLPLPIIEGLARRDNGPSIPLFPSSTGGWFDERRFGEVWVAARGRAGLTGDPDDPMRGRRKPPTPHDARKSVVSLLFALGASVPEVLAWVGHADSKVTLAIYATVQDWDRLDPVLAHVRNLGLSLPDAWARLYTETWATYGDRRGGSVTLGHGPRAGHIEWGDWG